MTASSRRDMYAEQARYRPTLGEMAMASIKQANSIDIYLQVGYKKLYGFANPSQEMGTNGFPLVHSVFFNGSKWADVKYGAEGWEASVQVEQEVLDAVGDFLIAWYQ